MRPFGQRASYAYNNGVVLVAAAGNSAQIHPVVIFIPPILPMSLRCPHLTGMIRLRPSANFGTKIEWRARVNILPFKRPHSIRTGCEPGYIYSVEPAWPRRMWPGWRR